MLSAPSKSWVMACELPRGVLPTGHLVNTDQVNLAPRQMAGGEEAGDFGHDQTTGTSVLCSSGECGI